MTQKELEAQAKEYGYTVEEIREFRKHIKPFLKYAIVEIDKCRATCFLCLMISDYTKNSKLQDYLYHRLWAAMPKDAGGSKSEDDAWWADLNMVMEGYKKRLDFCKQQLKIVKP